MSSAQALSTRIARRTALAWSAGVLALATLCIAVAWQGNEAQLDAQLRAYAYVGYGLAWFDDEGYHNLLDLEQEGIEPGFDVAVFRPDQGTLYGQDHDVFPSLAAIAMETEDEVVADHGGLRTLAIPTWDHTNVPVAAILVTAPTGPTNAFTELFASLTLAGAGLLILGGLVVSQRLSRDLLEALTESIAERERILAGAAHELRTPLATLGALVDAPPDATTQQRIRQTVVSASGMVDRLLTWSRLAYSDPELQPLRLDLLVEACLDEEDPFEGEATVVLGDPRLLEVAVRNLVANARTHGGGLRQVRVAAGRVEVLDEGSGIPGRTCSPPSPRAAGARAPGSAWPWCSASSRSTEASSPCPPSP